MDFISIDDLMQNYTAYDVDITVNDIYHGDLGGKLLKDIIACSMGKNKGDKVKSFLKSFLFSCAINGSKIAT